MYASVILFGHLNSNATPRKGHNFGQIWKVRLFCASSKNQNKSFSVKNVSLFMMIAWVKAGVIKIGLRLN